MFLEVAEWAAGVVFGGVEVYGLLEGLNGSKDATSFGGPNKPISKQQSASC